MKAATYEAIPDPTPGPSLLQSRLKFKLQQCPDGVGGVGIQSGRQQRRLARLDALWFFLGRMSRRLPHDGDAARYRIIRQLPGQLFGRAALILPSGNCFGDGALMALGSLGHRLSIARLE